MTLKTPEEVAFEVSRRIPGVTIAQAWEVAKMLAEAVRYDRAQIIADMTEAAHPDDWGVPCVYVETYAKRLEDAS